MLHSYDLDANSLNQNQKLKKMNFSGYYNALIGVLLMTITSIPVIIGSGLQSIMARYMAEISDEGLDARTTYFFLAGMFSPVIFWPFTSFVITFLSLWNDVVLDYPLLSHQALLCFISIIFVFYISSLIFLLGYDHWSNFRKLAKISKFSNTPAGDEFNILIKKLNTQLGPLK